MLESAYHKSVLQSSSSNANNKRPLIEDTEKSSKKRRIEGSHNIFEGLESFQNANMNDLCKTSIIPYITCNEQQQKKTLKKITQILTEMPLDPEKDIYIGFSMWFNLDVLSVCDLKYAVILDFDPKVMLIYHILEKSLKSATSPEDFLERFLSGLDAEALNTKYSKDIQESQIREQLTKGYGFLSSQVNFLRVKSMCEENRIFFGSVDVVNEKDMAQLSAWCKNTQLTPRCLYISNISEWVSNSSYMDIFKKNLSLLINERILLIDAFFPSLTAEGSGPPQRITQGNLPEFKKKVTVIHKNNPRFNSAGEKKLLPRKLFFKMEEPKNIQNDEADDSKRLEPNPCAPLALKRLGS